MKNHVNFRYNNETRQCDFIVNGEVIDCFSSKDVTYLSSLSLDEIWSGRCCDMADKYLGEGNYLLDYFIDGNGYKVDNAASELG